MANLEASLQYSKWFGKQAMGTDTSKDVNPFSQELTPEQQNRIKKRWTPRTMRAIADGLNMVSIGVKNEDPGCTYVGLVEYATVATYGERGIGAIDWDKSPSYGIPERRYLVVMSSLGESFRKGDYDVTRQMMKGLTAYSGSNADSGGFPCSPEVLFALMVVQSYIQTILVTCPPTDKDRGLNSQLEYQVMKIVQGFALGDRPVIARAIDNLGEITNAYLKHRKTENRFASIHPLLERLAHKIIPPYPPDINRRSLHQYRNLA